MMMKQVWFAAALVSTALLTGCATGGGGHTGHQIQVTVDTTPSSNQSLLGVTLTLQFKATVTGTDQQAVTWSATGSGCSGNTCGTIDANGLYTAPQSAPADGQPVIVKATLQSDAAKFGSFGLTVLPLVVVVTPKLTTGDPVVVTKGVMQQFTAIVTPDNEAQTVTWSLTCDGGGNSCGTINANGVYTAPYVVPNPATGHVSATSTLDAAVLDTADITIASSRLIASSTYAFRVSGSNATGPIAVAGNFSTTSGGAIVGGTQDELTSTQHFTRTITGGSLTMDSNVHGTLTLTTSAGPPRTYKVVFNADGDGRMIEFDAVARASGEIVLANKGKFNNNALSNCKDANNNPTPCSFVFGLVGVDPVLNPVLKRTGLVGSITSGTPGSISAGKVDINDGGVLGSATDLAGTYTIASDGRGAMQILSSTLGITYNYAIYVTSGVTNKAVKPLTLFVISTDDPLSNPAVSGSIVFQDPTPGYANADFKDFFVANLTGVDTNGNTRVSLTGAIGNGTGTLGGTYDANNAGTIVAAKGISNYPYASTGNGRYTLDLLSDPPVHFVLYSSAASRGFLLSVVPADSIVYTGTMDQQPGSDFATAELAGSLAAAPVNPASSGAAQAAMNLLFSSDLPHSSFTVAGKQDETDGGQHLGQPLAGTYTVNTTTASGTMVLTSPAAANYVMYFLDNPKLDGRAASTMIQHFVMINVDPANSDPAVIFGER